MGTEKDSRKSRRKAKKRARQRNIAVQRRQEGTDFVAYMAEQRTRRAAEEVAELEVLI